MSSQNLLSYIRKILTIDVDSMDPAVASRHTTQSESFCDMTSNQAIVYGEITRSERRNVLEAVLRQVEGGENEADALQHALDLAVNDLSF